MQLGMGCYQTFNQELTLRMDDESSRTIFMETQDFLECEGDYMNAVKVISRRKKTDSYRSYMDFLICELFPGIFKAACFRYYNDKGPKLMYLMTPTEVVMWDDRLCQAVCIAKEIHDEERKVSWGWKDYVDVTYDKIQVTGRRILKMIPQETSFHHLYHELGIQTPEGVRKFVEEQKFGRRQSI